MTINVDNDMEIILKGDQVTAIREMLRDRFFALIKMPAKKPECYKFSSSVFVGHMNRGFVNSLAIRQKGSLICFEDCEYYLVLFHSRDDDVFGPVRNNTDNKEFFDKCIEHIVFPGTEVTNPSFDEFSVFMADKEFVYITNFVEEHNIEKEKSRRFLDDYLLWSENYLNRFILNEDYLDIRIFLMRVETEGSYPEYGLYPEDIRTFDIREKITDYLKKISKECFQDESDYFLEYESQSPDIQAVYFATKFHSNPAWSLDPESNFVFRICAFVLPGTISPKKSKKLPLKKKTSNSDTGSEYVIDSIHCNSDICYDLSEFKELIHGLYYDVFLA